VYTICRFDELADDAQTVTGLAHASFQNIAYAELAPNLAHVDRSPFVGEGRVACDHEQCLAVRQAGDDFLDQAVDEILLLGIAAHVLKGQHGNRWFVGQRRRPISRHWVRGRRSLGNRPICRLPCDSKCLNRTFDILEC
jgi:hypothetical protein